MAEKLSQAEPPADHNTAAGKAMFLSFMRQASTAKQELDEKNGVYRGILKAAKKAGINQQMLIKAMEARALDPVDVAKNQRDFARYMEWLGQPIGTQADMFGAEGAPKPDESMSAQDHKDHEDWQAMDAGYKAGRTGAVRESNPHQVGSERCQLWDKQWVRGQTAIAAEMGPGVENVAPPKRGKGVPKASKKGKQAEEATDPDEEPDAEQSTVIH